MQAGISRLESRFLPPGITKFASTKKLTESKIVAHSCLFCKSPLSGSTRTGEHVIPVWLLQHYHERYEYIQPVAWHSRNSEVVSWRHQRWNTLCVKEVCEKCNCQWLSGLENTAKSIILSVADGDSDVEFLSQTNKSILGRWAVKTALMMNRSSPGTYKIPREVFWQFYDHEYRLPLGCFAFAKRIPYEDLGAVLNGFESQYSHIHGSTQDFVVGNQVARKSLKVSLKICNLHLLVLFLEHELEAAFRPVAWRNVHIPLSKPESVLYSDFKISKEKVHQTYESAMLLFHVALCLGMHTDQFDMHRARPPIEQMHNEVFNGFQQAASSEN